jgi:hypothetical protein
MVVPFPGGVLAFGDISFPFPVGRNNLLKHHN